MSRDYDIMQKTRVIFRYPNAKGLFVDVPNFRPGGAPIQMYTLATELAKDPKYDVRFWVDGEAPKDRIKNVKLISNPAMVENGIPIVSRFENQKRKKAFSEEFRNAVCIFSVTDKNKLSEWQRMIHSVGGKTVYRIASDVEVIPSLRFSDVSDPLLEVAFGTDVVISQTNKQQRLLKENFGRDSIVVRSTFIESGYEEAERDCILWVGQSVAIKRPWIVLDLARRFPGEQFVMVMPEIDKNLALSIKEDAKSIANLQIISHVDPDKIQTYFNRAKVVLNTSVYEGYPNTLHQASIARAPYLSLSWNSDNCFDAHDMGACAENNVLLMVKLLNEYLESPDLREKIGKNAYDNYQSAHSLEKVVEDFKTVIDRASVLES